MSRDDRRDYDYGSEPEFVEQHRGYRISARRAGSIDHDSYDELYDYPETRKINREPSIDSKKSFWND